MSNNVTLEEFGRDIIDYNYNQNVFMSVHLAMIGRIPEFYNHEIEKLYKITSKFSNSNKRVSVEFALDLMFRKFVPVKIEQREIMKADIISYVNLILLTLQIQNCNILNSCLGTNFKPEVLELMEKQTCYLN